MSRIPSKNGVAGSVALGVLLGVTIIALSMTILSGCEDRVVQKIGIARWTDTDMNTHWRHTVRLIGNLTPDSSSTTVVGRRYWCKDCKEFFNIPVPGFELAQ